MNEKLTPVLTSSNKGEMSKEHVFEVPEFWYRFKRKGGKHKKRKKYFGFKIQVIAELEDIQYGDWYQTLHRSTFWLAAKSASQLVNGSSL